MIIKNEQVKATKVSEGVDRKLLASVGNITAVEMSFEKDSIGAVHSHPHEQVGYVLSGSFELTIGDEKHIIQAGDTYYIKPNLLHGVVALADSSLLEMFTPQREDFLK